MSSLHAGNEMLLDVGGIVDGMLQAEGGTLVRDNPNLCFAPSLLWTYKNNSYIEYNLDTV